jgi:SAM-dependent methyltransferase
VAEKGFRHRFLTFLLGMNRAHLINMIGFPIGEESVVVDMGCNVGSGTRSLSLQAKTIGLEIDKNQVRWAKKCNRHIDFVCCDLCHLPLRKSSVNVAVCSSVLEHIENLQKALKEIAFVLQESGELVVGYPIETRLLAFGVKSFCRSESSTWEQRNIAKRKDLLGSPHTHKQNFSDIRKMLRNDFLLLEKRKIPLKWLPDLFSIYEIGVLLKKPKPKY